LPWKGYFDLIHDVDLFIFYDEVQYTKNDWRNRNKIKTPKGIEWLTIPVGTNLKRKIIDVKLNDAKWQRSHWDKIKANYSRAPYFKLYKDFFEEAYLKKRWQFLYEVNRYFIIEISRRFLDIKTEFADSRDFPSEGVKQEKLLSLLKNIGADCYISGPSAKSYIKEEDFISAGIKLIWKDYSDYIEYPQLYGNFEHSVSIIDLLFNTGFKAFYYIWGHRTNLEEEKNVKTKY
jgi:hypothetical protein